MGWIFLFGFAPQMSRITVAPSFGNGPSLANDAVIRLFPLPRAWIGLIIALSFSTFWLLIYCQVSHT
jgi:hypothetical protein